MTVFARFKYEKGRPALRVHIWDIFDYANLNTASINDMFESINDQLCDIYEEIDASGEIEEVSDDDSNSQGGYDAPSEDSANEMLINDIGGITKFNVFAETDQDSKSANTVSS